MGDVLSVALSSRVFYIRDWRSDDKKMIRGSQRKTEEVEEREHHETW
jgi:hypothetical protein